ncbi:unnamed protein product [Aphanomyces euteiches]
MAPPHNRTKKRKNALVGLGANEIAFIEDEIAAVAMEYGLEIDDDVAKSIQSRQAAAASTKKHKKGAVATPTMAKPSLDSKALQALLPKQCTIGPCKSPGCNCRGYVHDKKNGEDCHKCDHGKFLHSIVFSIESDDESKAIHGQVLLAMMYSLVVLGRLAATVVGSNAWTHASLELLQTSVQLYLKKQLLRSQQQDSSDADRPVLTNLSSEMQSHVVAAIQAVAATGRPQMRIKLAYCFDQMYFSLHSATLAIYGRSCGAVPPLDEYLRTIESHRKTSQTDYELFVSTLVDGDIPPDYHAAYEVKPKHGIQLLDILLTRLREGVQLFYEPSMGMNGEMDKVLSDLGRKTKESAKKLTKKQRMNLQKTKPTESTTTIASTTWPAYPLLSQWRDICKTWTDKLYGKAIPNPKALKTIAKYSPIVEMSAGLGYWNSLFPHHKIDSKAFDPSATVAWSPDTDGTDGDVDETASSDAIPKWSEVYQGNADILATPALKSRTLFLCAPPTTTLARDCLRHYKGKFLIHVGEWHGATGDRQFECDVMKSFNLKERVDLPNWGDSAYELTVWERKAKANEAALNIVECSACESTHLSLLKRCVLCKTMVYCSDDCMQHHAEVHTAEHARRLIFLHNDQSLEFDNPLHFAAFDWDIDHNEDFKTTSWKQMAKEDGDKSTSFAFKF